MNITSDVAGLVVNWMTGKRTCGAVNSIHKYYSEMMVYVVDDGTRNSTSADFFEIYRSEEYRPDLIYDQDISCFNKMGNTQLIEMNHHISHGAAIDYAIPFIKRHKWILHLDSDARLIKPGIIEFALDKVDKKCMVGIDKVQNSDYPHIANYCMFFRPDLAYDYSAPFRPIYNLGLEAGHRYVDVLKEDYSIAYKDLTPYFVHLRWGDDKQREIWERYY